LRFLADENFPRAAVAALEAAELAARSALPPGCGIVLFRVPAPSSNPAGQRLAARIAARDDWNGHFSVVEPGRVRMRRLRG
jgi:hypothetical protein